MSALAMAMVLTGAGAALLDQVRSPRPPVSPPVSVIRPPPPPMIYRPPLPPPPAPREHFARRARANLGAYFSVDDYPIAAVRAGEEGIVGFSLVIGRNGRVARCAVTSSSGSAALDQATCAILRERARYTPARDARGRTRRGHDAGRVSWRLPTD